METASKLMAVGARETTVDPTDGLGWPKARDLLALVKLRITVLEVIMLLGGLALAPAALEWSLALSAIVGTAMVVASANVLNMLIERDTDRLMERTAARPLPSGRMAPGWALTFMAVLFGGAVALLWFAVNPLTALLGVAAWAAYGFLYTPMKQRTTLALVVGAFPGAAPALMGWTAVTGEIGTVGLAYAAVLFFWQLPHFLAISLFRKDEYARAGIAVVPLRRGEVAARRLALLFAVAMFIASFGLVWVGAATWLYAAAAAGLGVWFLLRMRWMETDTIAGWGRRVFFASLVYLPLLSGALVIDVAVH